ncbi:MAG: hypothetical protein E7632_13785 [Ruminococcaceae bacterium]|nr:hypothetical protein [Oscillospiraceae bacterium]
MVTKSNKQLFLDALQNRTLGHKVPLWELTFHLWKQYDPSFKTGPEFFALSEEEKIEAVKNNARIMKKVGEELGFGCVSIPDGPWDCIYTLHHEHRIMLIRELKALDPDFAIAGGCNGILFMPSSCDSYLDFCYWIMDEPEEVDEHCIKYYDSFTKSVTELIDAGLDVVFMPADVADNRTTFFNREQLDRWYLPYLKKSVEFLHERGIPSILHTDGNVSTILEDIRDSGVDALQAIDPIAGMSIGKTLEVFDGKSAACGNFDCALMLSGTPEEVYESAKEILLTNKNKPGFIFGNSNAVVLETPLENYHAMIKAWNDFGNIE